MLLEDAFRACSVAHDAFQCNGEALHYLFYHFLAACLPDFTGLETETLQPVRLFRCIAENMYLVPGFVPGGKLYALNNTDSITLTEDICSGEGRKRVVIGNRQKVDAGALCLHDNILNAERAVG